MPRLTEAERERRRRKMQQEALESVAARGQFNFRLDGRDIRRLYELAGRRQRPVSAMIREWVLERLEAEESGKNPAPPWAQEMKQRLANTELLIALAALSSTQDPQSEAIKVKVREHILRHGDLECDKELRDLL